MDASSPLLVERLPAVRLLGDEVRGRRERRPDGLGLEPFLLQGLPRLALDVLGVDVHPRLHRGEIPGGSRAGRSRARRRLGEQAGDELLVRGGHHHLLGVVRGAAAATRAATPAAPAVRPAPAAAAAAGPAPAAAVAIAPARRGLGAAPLLPRLRRLDLALRHLALPGLMPAAAAPPAAAAVRPASPAHPRRPRDDGGGGVWGRASQIARATKSLHGESLVPSLEQQSCPGLEVLGRLTSERSSSRTWCKKHFRPLDRIFFSSSRADSARFEPATQTVAGDGTF